MTRLLALLAALALAAPAQALELVYGPGTHVLTQTVFTPADQPVTIRCPAGPQQTQLVMNAGGLDITYDQQLAAPRIEGCSLVTYQIGGGTALTITGPVLPTGVQHGPVIKDIAIRGGEPAVQWWNKGIRLVDVWNPILRDINVNGLYEAGPNFSQATCLEFERSQVVDVEKLDCYHVQKAVKQIGGTFGEGFSLRDFNLVGVNTGVSLKQGAGYVVADGHMNAAFRCLTANGKTELSITDVLCLKTNTSTLDFVGFYLTNGQHLHLDHNTIEGTLDPVSAGRDAGMVLGNIFYSQITNNACRWFMATYGCIIVGTMSHDNQFIGNQSRTGAGAVVQINGDAGINNEVLGNEP